MFGVIVKAVQQHCDVEHGLKYSRFDRQWLYTLKAVMCILLGREGGFREDYPVVVAYTDGGSGSGEYGTVYWCEYLAVGWGLWRGWHYSLYQDASD